MNNLKTTHYSGYELLEKNFLKLFPLIFYEDLTENIKEKIDAFSPERPSNKFEYFSEKFLKNHNFWSEYSLEKSIIFGLKDFSKKKNNSRFFKVNSFFSARSFLNKFQNKS